MATLKQIQAKLRKLQTQTESLIAQKAQAVLDDIRAMMERHGLTTADLEAHRKRGKRAAQLNVAYPAPADRREKMNKLASKGKLPAKYRNPKTGETWSGWARPPAWIANVKDRSKFLIDAEGNEGIVKARKTSAKKVAAKKSAGSASGVLKAKKTANAPAAKKAVAKKAVAKKATAKKTSSARSESGAAAKTAKPAIKRKRPGTPPSPATTANVSAATVSEAPSGQANETPPSST